MLLNQTRPSYTLFYTVCQLDTALHSYANDASSAKLLLAAAMQAVLTVAAPKYILVGLKNFVC